MWAENDNQQEISFLDVKELYDAAYAEKENSPVNLVKFTALLAQADQMFTTYMDQLKHIEETRYTEPATMAA